LSFSSQDTGVPSVSFQRIGFFCSFGSVAFMEEALRC
jgi:hypothetical protein